MPAGNPVPLPMPVAPVVDIVIGVKEVFTTREGEEDGLPAVLSVQVVKVISLPYDVPAALVA